MEEKKNGRLPDTQSAESLVQDAQAARVREHVRAILTRLKSHALKSSREAK
jgi:hypothetical protein